MSLAGAIKSYGSIKRENLGKLGKGKYYQAMASGVGEILEDVVSIAGKVGKGVSENIESWEDYEGGLEVAGYESGEEVTGLKRWFGRPKLGIETSNKSYTAKELMDMGFLSGDPASKLRLGDRSLADMFGTTLADDNAVKVAERGGKQEGQSFIPTSVSSKEGQEHLNSDEHKAYVEGNATEFSLSAIAGAFRKDKERLGVEDKIIDNLNKNDGKVLISDSITDDTEVMKDVYGEEGFADAMTMWQIENSGEKDSLSNKIGPFQFTEKMASVYRVNENSTMREFAEAQKKLMKENLKVPVKDANGKTFDVKKELGISAGLEGYLAHQLGRGKPSDGGYYADVVTGYKSGRIAKETKLILLNNLPTGKRQQLKGLSDGEIVRGYIDYWKSAWEAKQKESRKKFNW